MDCSYYQIPDFLAQTGWFCH
uniref:Uncharacterized protein n=1 Tax=Rhizophora mucronata TaxID=61149 RepID=A0A2P2NNF7_RHIMU